MKHAVTSYKSNVNDSLLITSCYRTQKSKAAGFDDQTLCWSLCFVQAENGRVLEISYEQSSHLEGVNLKKSIAAAFQANFQKQEEEEEEDPQSLHVAHYQ